jgi:anthranilate synthase component II
MTSVLVVDNYDSFTYNLVQYLGELGADVDVVRNDMPELLERRPDRVIVSPGPCTPEEAGLSKEAIRRYAEGGVPVLGVCLGHQCIGEVFGGDVVRAPTIMHGKTSLVRHAGAGVLAGLPDPFEATRYHSLVIERESLPDCLEITAKTWHDEIMGVRHRSWSGTATPVEGVQFHPESIMTTEGKRLLQNFLDLGGRRGEA